MELEWEIIGHTGVVSYIFCRFCVFRITWEVVYFGELGSKHFFRFLCTVRACVCVCVCVCVYKHGSNQNNSDIIYDYKHE